LELMLHILYKKGILELKRATDLQKKSNYESQKSNPK
jgi:hypothetical protein